MIMIIDIIMAVMMWDDGDDNVNCCVHRATTHSVRTGFGSLVENRKDQHNLPFLYVKVIMDMQLTSFILHTCH